MNPRLMLAQAALPLMTRMYEDNQPFRPYEPRDSIELKVRFAPTANALFREPHRELKEFSIKGYKVMAYSRKDAITRLKHQKKI